MAEFIYTTSITVYRPVFIDADKLEALDKILDEEMQRLHRYNESRINIEVEKGLTDDWEYRLGLLRLQDKVRDKELQRAFDESSPVSDEELSRFSDEEEAEKQKLREELRKRISSRFRETRNITIYLKGNKKTVVSSFVDALRQQALLDEIPVRFEVTLRSGDIGCDIRIDRDGDLTIGVSPEHLSESRELFASVQRWALSVRPPAWQRWWVVLNFLQWPLFIIGLLIAASIASNSENTYKEQAVQLLKDGVTQDEQLKAIELILLLEAGLVPTGQGKTPGWFMFFLVGGLILCVILSVTPKSMIGIGKGEEKIKRWRIWLRIVFILVPGFIFVQILLPYLLRWLGLS
ncbi:MAG TPA: hypothetical protein VGB98_14905 [Pyrinomonadaceae bacterium]|jgi:hypothetical protein